MSMQSSRSYAKATGPRTARFLSWTGRYSTTRSALIYLNAAIESWRTVKGLFSLGSGNDPVGAAD